MDIDKKAKLLLLGFHECDNCRNHLGNNEVTCRPEPYHEEILNEIKMMWLCETCYYEMSQDI